MGLTRAAAVRYAKKNIRINAVCPGLINTEMLSSLDHDTIVKQIPMGRLGESQDVANAVAWLSSDYASFITGSSFVIDGGITA